jgi:hypothetical protein
MATKEQLAAIKELAGKKQLSAEQQAAIDAWVNSQQEEIVRSEPENFAKARAGEMAMLGGAGDPLRAGSVEEFAADTALGLSPEEIAQKNFEGTGKAIDIMTGAAPTRAAIGAAMGAPMDYEKMLLEGVPMGSELVESSPRFKDSSPLAKTAAATLLDVADPGLIAGVGGLLKGATQRAGKNLFSSGVKNIDKLSWKAGKGKDSFANTLRKYKVKGTSESIFEQSDDVLENLLKERDAIFAQATQKGAVVDADRVLKPVIKQADSLAKSTEVIDKNVKKQAKEMADNLKDFAKANKRVPEQMPEPEQIPAFFEQELPTGKQELIAGQDIVTQQVNPKASPTYTPQMELLPESPEALAVMKEEATIAPNIGVGREAQNLTDDEILAMLNNQEGVLPFGSNVDFQGPVGRVQGKAAPLPEVGEQLNLLPITESYASKAGVETTAMPWQISQGKSSISSGQQSLLRPSDLMPEAKPIPASGGLSPTKSSSVKTQLYNMLSSEPYGILRQDEKGQGLLKKAAARFNTATTEAVRKVDPKAAKRLREINKDMGALLTGRPAALNEAMKEISKNAVTSVDAPLAILNPQAYIGKKAADIGKGTFFRTVGGAALEDPVVSAIIGGMGGATAAGAKSALINAYEKQKRD